MSTKGKNDSFLIAAVHPIVWVRSHELAACTLLTAHGVVKKRKVQKTYLVLDHQQAEPRAGVSRVCVG